MSIYKRNFNQLTFLLLHAWVRVVTKACSTRGQFTALTSKPLLQPPTNSNSWTITRKLCWPSDDILCGRPPGHLFFFQLKTGASVTPTLVNVCTNFGFPCLLVFKFEPDTRQWKNKQDMQCGVLGKKCKNDEHAWPSLTRTTFAIIHVSRWNRRHSLLPLRPQTATSC